MSYEQKQFGVNDLTCNFSDTLLCLFCHTSSKGFHWGQKMQIFGRTPVEDVAWEEESSSFLPVLFWLSLQLKASAVYLFNRFSRHCYQHVQYTLKPSVMKMLVCENFCHCNFLWFAAWGCGIFSHLYWNENKISRSGHTWRWMERGRERATEKESKKERD